MFLNDDKCGDYDDDYDDDEDEEYITEIIVKPSDEPIPTSIYKSKYRKSIDAESTHNKYEHKTLGVMKVSLNTPDKFLKKNSRIHLKQPEVNHKHYRQQDYQQKLSAWEPLRLSKVSDKPLESSVKLMSFSKNFKKENIINIKKARHKSSNLQEITSALPLSEKPQYFISKHPGDPKIRPKYSDYPPIRIEINSKDDVNKISAELTSIRGKTNSIKNFKKLPNGHYVTDEERADLLLGMKKKWDELMRQFQALPFLSDTPPKAKRKSKMEENLKQLEKDIDDIERHPYIYVYDDIIKGSNK
ncbi:hypothetical protein PV325_004146 [Microctonus aethiopoides]|uniref:Enkurin domain-containing protein n=1 Tax=Microctonus aethiopoides TaxID=144406 RepID=A0AA39F0K8_9HYME|nr:hypothetical protein PV325_004146 [Microctonus aethiopoides]KAK0097718.1 hypothetical protein PV326_014246 [Microctonus aethiopoides]KAK0158113.1 hypothetical protein PV328_009158 [Microctonus aethiopoides]